MLSHDSSPTHLYFAEWLLKIREEHLMGNKKYLKNLKSLQGNQNHQMRNARLKKFTKKQDYGSTNFIKKYFQEEGDEEDGGGWKLIY